MRRDIMLDIRNDNLRLIFSKQEAAYIDFGLKKAIRRLVVHGLLLVLLAALWSSGQLADIGSALPELGWSMKIGTPAAWEITLKITVIGAACILPVVTGACFCNALVDMLKCRDFRKDHASFLWQYNRPS